MKVIHMQECPFCKRLFRLSDTLPIHTRYDVLKPLESVQREDTWELTFGTTDTDDTGDLCEGSLNGTRGILVEVHEFTGEWHDAD